MVIYIKRIILIFGVFVWMILGFKFYVFFLIRYKIDFLLVESVFLFNMKFSVCFESVGDCRFSFFIMIDVKVFFLFCDFKIFLFVILGKIFSCFICYIVFNCILCIFWNFFEI